MPAPDKPGTARSSNPANSTYVLGFEPKIIHDLRESMDAGLPLHPDAWVNTWVAEQLAEPRLQTEIVPLQQLQKWRINGENGNIEHETGMFFTVTGLSVRHRAPREILHWDQPIIDQPEIGILGILAKRINGVLHFCLQAKEEPGNVNSVQLSPTVQATYSNYTRVHGGITPPFLEHFISPAPEKLMFAKLQTEDGGRFLYKSNRNMIVLVDDNEDNDLPPSFIWLTLRQISQLFRQDNLIHACTRSILSALVPAVSTAPLPGRQPINLGDICQWLDSQKASNHFFAKRQGLNQLQEWHLDNSGAFTQLERRFFRIIGIQVRSVGREVTAWSQPILANPASGIIGLLIRHRNGRREYLMQAKAEVGNRTAVQLGPTIQITPANYIDNRRLTKPFLFDEFAAPSRYRVLFDNYQAEEGARFYKEAHRHLILELPAGVELALPTSFRWLTDAQLHFLLQMGEQVNPCARSIISCLMTGAVNA